jgi:tRNA1Val (adenine37-N6)-methyltransferase
MLCHLKQFPNFNPKSIQEMQPVFKFKKFSLHHHNSTMKVGTDAVLLGAWVDVAGVKKVLDIGTGCGVIALMIAQRSLAEITAIDIDRDSVAEAALNFKNSPWPERLQAMHVSAADFMQARQASFDLIVSNPPFFKNGVKPANKKSRFARHDEILSFRELFSLAKQMLAPHGKLGLILPATRLDEAIDIAKGQRLFPQKTMHIYPIPGKPAVRCMVLFAGNRNTNPEKESLIIETNGRHGYAKAYQNLTADFYPHFPLVT